MISFLIERDNLRLDTCTYISLISVTSVEEAESWKEGKVVLKGLAWSLEVVLNFYGYRNLV